MKLTYKIEFEDGSFTNEKTVELKKILMMMFPGGENINTLFMDDGKVDLLKDEDGNQIIIKAKESTGLHELTDSSPSEDDFVNSVNDSNLVICFTNNKYKGN